MLSLFEKEIRQQARANIIEQIKGNDFLISENKNDISDYGHLIDEETERLSSLQMMEFPLRFHKNLGRKRNAKLKLEKEAARQEQARRNANVKKKSKTKSKRY